MILIVPESYPNQALQATLSGVDCLLTLDLQARTGRWRLSLALLDGASLVQGVKVANGTNLLARAVHPDAPVGVLICAPKGAKVLDPPGLDSWGVTHDLVWLDAADLAEAAAL